MATAVAVVTECLDQASAPGSVVSIGIGIPGQVDPATGLVRTAVNLGISELDLGPRLTAALGLPVTVDNDVKAAALGAANHLGLADGDLAYLNFGTGVAAAAVVHGRLVRGHGNLAGRDRAHPGRSARASAATAASAAASRCSPVADGSPHGWQRSERG